MTHIVLSLIFSDKKGIQFILLNSEKSLQNNLVRKSITET